jgi:hypothetical protein
MSSRPLDTTPEAWARWNGIFERMTGEQRLRLALEMSADLREIRLAGIRVRHPGASDEEVVRLLVREDYGIELPAGA